VWIIHERQFLCPNISSTYKIFGAFIHSKIIFKISVSVYLPLLRSNALCFLLNCHQLYSCIYFFFSTVNLVRDPTPDKICYATVDSRNVCNRFVVLIIRLTTVLYIQLSKYQVRKLLLAYSFDETRKCQDSRSAVWQV
jgi:hypothetical protein